LTVLTDKTYYIEGMSDKDSYHQASRCEVFELLDEESNALHDITVGQNAQVGKASSVDVDLPTTFCTWTSASTQVTRTRTSSSNGDCNNGSQGWKPSPVVPKRETIAEKQNRNR